ncbi:MAG: glycerate kinase [Spirochaetes bacterium]|nr:glycerate kinase [Spirochaetota bacterium]
MAKVRDDLKTIYTAAIEAVEPAGAVRAHVSRRHDSLILSESGKPFKEFNLNNYRRILLVGAGKATAPMASAIEHILGDRLDAGCICVKRGYVDSLARTEIIEASHPVPDANGMKGAKKILDLIRDATADELVISCISGGGSALLVLPAEPVTLENKQRTTDLLIKSGAGIHEINAVRKHLSSVKGGNLAAATGATVINLMISDVVGDGIDVIASGPFSPDTSTFADALRVLERYDLVGSVPAAVVDRIRSGARGEIPENPGPESPAFRRVTNLILASNIIALDAARKAAAKLGYNSIILSSMIEGDTSDAAFWHARIAREVVSSSNPVSAPACILSGGETTVVVAGDGLGGRNMEFAMRAAPYIDGIEGILIASIGTDGTDGPTDAAGAFVDGSTMVRSQEKGMDIKEFVRRNDSYHFHERIGGLIFTGPTKTNVMDIRIMLVERHKKSI